MIEPTTNKGGRGKRAPNAIRYWVVPPRIRPEIARLLEAIATARGGSKSMHLERALIAYATLEEVESAGLVE